MTDEGFKRWWDAWPKGPRRVNKKGCLAKWQADKLEAIAEKIIAHTEWSVKNNDQWKSGYAPMPITYLNQARYDDGTYSIDKPKTPELSQEHTSPSAATRWIVANKELSPAQVHGPWKWITRDGVLVGVEIPGDDPYPSVRVMFDEMFDLSEPVFGG